MTETKQVSEQLVVCQGYDVDWLTRGEVMRDWHGAVPLHLALKFLLCA